MRFSSALLLLCLASPASGGLFNRKNGDSRRRRLSETPQVEEWDTDASTGTVRKMPDPKEEEAKTCDGQMAKSLVKANDDLLQAQSERDAASKGLKEKETSNALLEQELEETKNLLTTKVETLEEQLEQSKEEAAKKMEQVTNQGDEQEQKLVAESVAKLQVYKTEMEAKIEGLTQRLESQVQKEKESVQAAVAKVEEEKTTAVLKAEEEKTAAIKVVEQEKAALAKENAEIKKSLAEKVATFKSQKKELKSTILKVTTESDMAIKALEHWENLHASRSYCNVTHVTEDVSAAAMVYKEKAADKLREFKETASVSARKLQVETVRLANENMEKSKTLAQEAMVKARPYYEENLKPHVDKAVEAAKPYVDQATAAAKPHVDKVTVAAKPYLDQATVATKPYLEKAAVMADETLFPILAQAKEELIVAMEIANKKSEETFNKVVAKYAEECPKASASLKNFAKEQDFQIPVSVLQSLDTSCQQPQESVIMALYIVGAIFLLLFRKALLRLVKWLIFLPFRILWFFNPLRFCFGSKKKNIVPAPTKAVPPSGSTPVGIKKKQRNNASNTRVSQ